MTATGNLPSECRSPHNALSSYWCHDRESRFSRLIVTPWECFSRRSHGDRPPWLRFLLWGHVGQCRGASLRVECSQKPAINWTEVCIEIDSTHIYISLSLLLDIRARTTNKKLWEKAPALQKLNPVGGNKVFDVKTQGGFRQGPGHVSIREKVPEVDSAYGILSLGFGSYRLDLGSKILWRMKQYLKYLKQSPGRYSYSWKHLLMTIEVGAECAMPKYASSACWLFWAGYF